jgi:hypothetical protein
MAEINFLAAVLKKGTLRIFTLFLGCFGAEIAINMS